MQCYGVELLDCEDWPCERSCLVRGITAHCLSLVRAGVKFLFGKMIVKMVSN